MSQLSLYPSTPAQGSPMPELVTGDERLIQRALAERGIRFERWPARQDLPDQAGQAQILSLYAAEIARVQQGGTYPTVDAIRITPDHPDRDSLRQKFLQEHTHSEDEVRFFVEGRGLFCLHLGDEVVQILCERNDWIAVPAGTRHWFDMGEAPSFCALRFFNNPEGWVAQFTGDPIADRYPRLDELACGGFEENDFESRPIPSARGT
ncbi:acireductone dioxygenase [Synechococcus sp. CCY9201]|uniref:1,2-dihydroxy-3-keto-5-methylthiopentene dioxygenase n=1 Tax=unclassified Synechococcus TaxID=2626047 RepID=UPI002AD277E9|nr:MULTISPECIES: acireductone dioxygenase [unclassified Synechococcus]MEA5473664.1 acireductone dioxygenase [Synechococcus sp. CCY9201]